MNNIENNQNYQLIDDEKKMVYRILELKENESIKNILSYPVRNLSEKFNLFDFILDNLLGTYKNTNNFDITKYNELKNVYNYLSDDWFLPGVAICTLFMCMLNQEWANNFTIPKELYYYVLFDSDNTIGYVKMDDKRVNMTFERFIQIKFGMNDWKIFKRWLLNNFNNYKNN